MSHRIPKPSFSSVAAGNWNNVEASTPKIIVKFARRATRERFYVARKNLRDKTAGNLDLLLPSENKIYISENLTATNRELFKDCLKVKKRLELQIHLDTLLAGFFFAKILEVLLLWFQIDLFWIKYVSLQER